MVGIWYERTRGLHEGQSKDHCRSSRVGARSAVCQEVLEEDRGWMVGRSLRRALDSSVVSTRERWVNAAPSPMSRCHARLIARWSEPHKERRQKGVKPVTRGHYVFLCSPLLLCAFVRYRLPTRLARVASRSLARLCRRTHISPLWVCTITHRAWAEAHQVCKCGRYSPIRGITSLFSHTGGSSA